MSEEKKKRRPKQKRTTAQRLKDEQRVAQMLLESPGVSQAAIARELEVSQATISRHKVALYQKWIEGAQEHFTQMMIGQLQRSQWRYEQAMEAWEASKEPRKESAKTMQLGQATAATMKSVEKDGDPRFLEVMRKEDEYQARLLGLLRDRVDVTSNGRTIGVSADVLARVDEQASGELDEWVEGRFAD
jgi:predicted transcriptional regulator